MDGAAGMAKKRGVAEGKGAGRTSIWLRPARPPRDDAGLSRERIVAAAIELLDAEGIDGLTMRGLADRLGSGVMSLYWHVETKEDVFDLALDSVLVYDAPPPAGDWREDVVHALTDWRAAMLRHPWSAALLPRRALGPNVLARLERLGQSLARGGIADADLNAAIWTLWNQVLGATITRVSFDVPAGERAATQDQLAQPGEGLPTIARTRLLLDDDWDGAFRKGQQAVLDGLSSKR